MAKKIIDDISRTFDEYLLLPSLTKKIHIPENVSLRVPVAKFKTDGKAIDLASKIKPSSLMLNSPFVSASMQAVSGPKLAIALARKGGASVIYCSQSIESQAKMVLEVKEHKAGFVVSDSNLSPEATLQDAVNLRNRTGHSTIAITEGGRPNTKLFGLLTSKDFWEFKDDLTASISKHFTPVSRLVFAKSGATLQEATTLLWQNKKECLPIIDDNGNLESLVFRRDYFDHKSNPLELTDEYKRLVVGAAINTHDYKDRVPALVEAGADFLTMDSSDGFSEWQLQTAQFIREKYGKKVILAGGNIVTAEGFDYLVQQADVDFVKVGIGGGSICITREQKGIGRGQASALLEVAQRRDEYYQQTGIYVPICSDGGIRNDTHAILALAMGADFVMMGKYFAMTEESPTEKFTLKGRLYKPYWGEGSNRAKNWQRYNEGKNTQNMLFEEGIDAYIPYSGTLAEKLDVTLNKIRSTLCNVGALNIREFQENVVLTRISPMTLVEGGTSSVMQLDS